MIRINKSGSAEMQSSLSTTRKKVGRWLIIPAAIALILLTIIPICYSLYVSSTEYSLTTPGSFERFIGAKNYLEALKDPDFIISVKNTLRISIPALILEVLIGFGIALVMNRNFRARGLILALLVTPYMIAPGAAALAWRLLFDTRYGPVNHILSLLAGHPIVIDWLGSPQMAYKSLIVIDVWQTTPFVMLTILAGLSSISIELYESATVDGASRFQMFKSITVPLVAPVLSVAVIFRLIDSLKMFDMCHALTKGGPGGTTMTLSYYIYRQGLAYGRVGYAAAISFIVLIVIVLLSRMYIKATMKGGMS